MRNPRRLPSRITGGQRSAIRSQIAAARTPSGRPPSSLNGANGMSDPSTQRYAVASIEGPSSPRRVFDRTGISDEGRSEVRAGLALRAANKFQNGNKVKQLRPGPTAHKFRGAASGAPRINRTWETRRLARSIRDVAFASRREFVAEARPRCGSSDRLTWTQLSARQAQFFGQTTWRICSLEIAAEEMARGCGNEESLPYMILSAPHRNAATVERAS
jgi:hypothetical protein